MEPLEVPSEAWQISYGESYEEDGLRLYAIGSGARFTARAVAKIGQLVLQEGRWRDREILRRKTVQTLIRPTAHLAGSEFAPAVSRGWWSNADGSLHGLPRDALMGLGANHAILLVVPSLDLVVVRLGRSLGTSHWGGKPFWDELETKFLVPLEASLAGVR